MEYELIVNYEKCVGCRTCEASCSLHHGQAVNPQKSRIRIVKLESEADVTPIPIKCQQCENPPCETVCPVGAISTSITTGARLVDKKKCIGCSSCVYACPFGAAFLDRAVKSAIICDLCDGDPMCVKMCPWETLQYIRSDDVSIKLKRTKADKLREVLKLASAAPE